MSEIDLNLLAVTLGVPLDVARADIVDAWKRRAEPIPQQQHLFATVAQPHREHKRRRAIYVPYKDVHDRAKWDAKFEANGWVPPRRNTPVTLGECANCGETIKYESWDCAFCSRVRNEQRKHARKAKASA